jgi:DNA-binding transcriptional ArsR family regulator
MTPTGLGPTGPQTLDRAFVALADPGRRTMVETLSIGPANVKQLAGVAKMGLPSALKHLRVLEDGGIVVSQKAGRVRTYSMAPGAFAAIRAWVGQREAVMNTAFDRLESLIDDIEGKATGP